MAGGPCSDTSLILFDLQKKRQEEEELRTVIKELSQIFASLQQRTDELQLKKKKQKNEHFSTVLLEEQENDLATEKAEKERKEVLHLDAKLESLKLEHAIVMGRKRTKQRLIQRHKAHQDLLDRTVRMTKFNKVQELIDHIENLLYFQDHFCEREDKAHEHVDQLKKSLLALHDNHHLQQLQDNYELSKLQTKMEKTRCETVSREREWSFIEETAAKKTLFLGKVKIATFNLYEMANEVEADKPVDMNDTYKQLDKVKMFIQTYGGIVKQHAIASQKQDAQEKDETKHITKSVSLNIQH